MATKKVGIYRNYYGPIPKDSSGRPLPKNEWPKKRAHSWVVRWHGQDGQRFSKSFPTRKEADLFSEEKQVDVRTGQGDPPPDTTLAEFGKMYMSIRSDLTERSRQEHARTVKLLKERIGKERPVNKITPLDARRFIAWYRERSRKDQPIAPATVNKLLRECRRIFREAVDCRLIRENPFNGIRQEKVPRNVWYHVTPEDYRKLIEAAPSLRWRGIIALAYCCGLRLSEILNLTWPDIDFEKEVVRVVAKRGKAGTEDWTPKDKDMRILPMPRPVTNVLTRVQAEAGDGQVYAFVIGKGSNAGQRMKRQNISRDFQAIRRRAGVARCCMHDLRRGYCTNLSKCVPIHVVQELAGHSDIRTTRMFYVQVEPELLEMARKAVEEAVS